MRKVTSLHTAFFLTALVWPCAATAWETIVDRAPFPGTPNIGGANDVVAHGAKVFATGYNSALAITALDGLSGQLLWRKDFEQESGAALASDATGNVIVVTNSFSVVKLAGVDGTEIWQHQVAGDAGYGSYGTDVTIDAAGDVLVAGAVSTLASGQNAVTVKLRGDTGLELWRYTEDSGPSSAGGANVVATDAFGDVVVAGSLSTDDGTAGASTLTKLAGQDGTPVWKRTFADLFTPEVAPGRSRAVASFVLDGVGDVIAAGYVLSGPMQNVPTYLGSVFKLSGLDGSDTWRHDLPLGTNLHPSPRVGILPSGSVIASDHDFTVTALAATDGGELWRRTLGCGPADWLQAMTVLADGTVAVIGKSSGTCSSVLGYQQLLVAKLAGDDGSDVWRRGFDARTPGQNPAPFEAAALTSSVDGTVIAAGQTRPITASTHSSAFFTLLGFAGGDGALHVCGDGYTDFPEVCDEGDTDVGGCCNARCDRAAADGTSCFDNDRCTTDDRCEAGRCVGGPPLLCEPCGTCSPSDGCGFTLPATCRAPTAPPRGRIHLRTRPSGGGAITWMWDSGAATTKADFGDPRSASGYALCVYATFDVPLMVAEIPPGKKCSRDGGCWRMTPKGFVYRSRRGGPDGIERVSLRAGGAGRARIIVQGGGRLLDVPELPLPDGLSVFLKKLDGSEPCWMADHPFILKNTDRDFVARGQ